MADDVTSSNENSVVILDGKDPPSKQNGSRIKYFGGDAGGSRLPFRKLSSSSSNSSNSSSSKTSRYGRKTGSLQRQKNSGKNIKCVIIGDSKTGKSALVRSFLGGQSNHPDYEPTFLDTHTYATTTTEVGGTGQENGENSGNPEMENVTLEICDTGGDEEMDRFRPLSYSQAQVVIICFNVMNPSSFSNVTKKWLPEVKRHGVAGEDPENPIKLLLVGTQSDLRSNVKMLLKLIDDGLAPVSEIQALRLANTIGALKYVESSSVSPFNVNHIFELAMTYGHGKFTGKQVSGMDLETGLQAKILSNLTEKKLLFWRGWKRRQNKFSKIKRFAFLQCISE